MSNSADSDREERYKHLLQPIRDLAQNWDVDIAASLEDYLEDLEDITITLDGGASKVNFAEAALLIQGSTSVYSRKVEHVYQLVQRTIDFLTQQKHQKNANASKSKNDDDDMAGGEEAAFLPLDDILEGKHIDIGVNVRYSSSSTSTRARNRRRSSAAPNEMSFHGMRGSAGMRGHREDREGGDGNLPDITRPPMFLMEQDYGNSFKMSTCAPQQQSGTLLIEGSTLEDSGSLSDSFNGGAAARASDFWRGLGREGDGGLKAPAGADGDRWTGDMGNANVNDDDDDSDGGGGFGFGGDFGGPEDDDDLDEQEPKDDLDATGTGTGTCTGTGTGAVDGPRTPVGSMLADGRELRQRAPPETVTAKADKDKDKAAVDPWAALDPHDPGTSQARPIRKGRGTHKLPPQLRKRRGKKIREGAEGDAGVGGGGGGEEQKDIGGSWVGHDGRPMSSVPLVGLAYSEFQYVSNREKQRKAAQTRLARQQARAFMGREEFLPTYESMPLNSNSAAGPGAGASGMDANANGYGGYESDGSYGSDGDGDGGFGDYGGGDDDGDDGGYGGAGGYGDADGGGGGGGGDGEGVGPISLEDAFREKPQTYEDVCRSHIEAFMRGTEKYAHETHLSKRVGAWQEKLEPLMESQEKRQAFDIHAYGQSVLSRVASVLTPAQRARATTAVKGTEAKEAGGSESSAARNGSVEDVEPDLTLVNFGVVVAGKERFDVCRLFLASLQLANNGNVRLFHGDNAAEQATTPFQLELLTLQNSDNMAGCFAPTASTAGSGSENPPQNGGKNGAKKSAGSKAKAKSAGRRGGRSGAGVVGTKETPSVIQATA